MLIMSSYILIIIIYDHSIDHGIIIPLYYYVKQAKHFQVEVTIAVAAITNQFVIFTQVMNKTNTKFHKEIDK